MQIRAKVRAGIEVVIDDLDGDAVDDVLAEFAYKNPLIDKFARMKRKFLADRLKETEPTVTALRQEDGKLIVPRGGATRLVELLEKRGVVLRFVDERLDLPRVDFSLGRKAQPATLKPHQEDMVRAAIGRETCVLRAATGSGKCLGRGTPVLLESGEVVPVEDVKKGDRLLGPDGRPRLVTSTSTGTGPLFDVVPRTRDPFTCNAEHVLTLVDTVTGEVEDLALSDYLASSKTRRHRLELFQPDWAPRRKTRSLRSGFDVVPRGVGEYFGFTLDGDGRFLLGDWTVTHNTEAALEIARRLERPTLVVVWTSGLLRQWIDRINLRFGWAKGDVGVVGGGQHRVGPAPITVGLQQSLCRDPARYADRFAVVIMEEAQRASATTYRELIGVLPARYRIAISADERRKDGMEHLIWDHFGPVAAEVTRRELVRTGDLCEVEFVLVPTGVPRPDFLERAPAEDRPKILSARYADVLKHLEASEARNALAARVASREAKEGRSTIVFCNSIASGQVSDLARRIAIEGCSVGTMIGGAENRADFEETKARLTSGAIRCAVASSAAYQGEDIPRLESGVVVTPTASNKQLFEQQVGRLRRKFPGKRMGTMFVLWDEQIFVATRRNLERWYGSRLVRIEEVSK